MAWAVPRQTCSMVKTWPTAIEAHVDVKTTAGCLLHLFCVGFTKKHSSRAVETSYTQHQQVHHIQKEMMEITPRQVPTGGFKEVVRTLILESVGKACQAVCPPHEVSVRKVSAEEAQV